MIDQRDFTGWKYYKNRNGENHGITIVHENGSQESIALIDPQVDAWIKAGNTPEPADE
jgi:hypothetical protein